LFSGGTGVWTQGLAHARQALHQTPALFCFSYFSGRVPSFCPGPASDHNHSTYSLHCNWDHRHLSSHLAYWLRRGLTFCPRLPWTMILLISVFQVVGITGVSYCTQLTLLFMSSLVCVYPSPTLRLANALGFSFQKKNLTMLSKIIIGFYVLQWNSTTFVCVCVYDRGFELRARHLQIGTLPLEPHLQSILLWLFWRLCLANYLPGITTNLDPPNLSLSNSLNYRCELLHLEK
jgi:hypothetical protein